VEHASRHAFACPLPSKESAEVTGAAALLFSVIGIPKYVQTDQGSEFMSSTFQSLLKRYNITHRVSSSGHPQSQGLVERFNQTLSNSLRRHCSGTDPTMWETFLPAILLGYNLSVQDSVKSEPARLFWGRPPQVPPSRMVPPGSPAHTTGSSSSYEEETESARQTREARNQANITQAL